MTIFNVHLYREMRLGFGGIEADTHEAAAVIARDKPTAEADSIDDCAGETFAAVVGVQGDEDQTQTRIILFEADLIRKAGQEMLAVLKAVLPYAENEARTLELLNSPDAEEEVGQARKSIEAAYAVIARSDVSTDNDRGQTESTGAAS